VADAEGWNDLLQPVVLGLRPEHFSEEDVRL